MNDYYKNSSSDLNLVLENEDETEDVAIRPLNKVVEEKEKNQSNEVEDDDDDDVVIKGKRKKMS